MSIKIEKTENNNELKLEFTIEAKKFDEAIIKVFNKSAKYFNIPGFRKGKAPFNIVERMYGDEIFYEDAFNELVPSIYEKEIEDNKLYVVSKPEINIVKMNKADKKRSEYYNYYSYKTWGAAATYHLCIDSSVLGIDETVRFIEEFVVKKLAL